MKASVLLTALLFAGPALGLLVGQTQSVTTPSLGELARQQRARREKAFVKPRTVFTNDNLPARPRNEGPTAASGISATPGEHSGGKTEAPGTTTADGATPASSRTESEVHDEKYYRGKMQELEARLQLHKRQLDVLQQKTAQNRMQYYPDPNKTLQQESTPRFYSDVTKLRSDIEKKRQEIAEDEKAMDDLRDQLRREGGNPGWLR